MDWLNSQMDPSSNPRKPGRTASVGIYLTLAAEVARTLTSSRVGDRSAQYIALFAVLIILYSIVLWRPDIPSVLLHLYFGVQSALTLLLLALNPEIDFVTTVFALLSFQAALVFSGASRWVWVGILVSLIPGSLMFFLGPLRGIALGLVTMAAGIVLPAFVAVSEETEQARVQSQALLDELQETHRQLQTYAEQVEELAAVEERNRLARELHDSVSQTIFSITLNTRTTQILLKQNPERVRAQLEHLQTLAQNALAQMRGLIAELRPP